MITNTRYVVTIVNGPQRGYYGPFVSEPTAYEYADRYPGSVVGVLKTPIPDQSTRPQAVA